MGRPRGNTRERIVEAAFETVREVGYAGATSRAIAARGDFNPALIFYYFGSVPELLLAALEHSSRARLARYREAVDAAASLADLARVLGAIYHDDIASGHIRFVSELVAASVANPELA